MTFLEILQQSHKLAGLQGTVSTVVGATGYVSTLVETIKNAWLDIQNQRSDFTFLKDNVTLSTVAGTTEYTVATVLGSATDTLSTYRGILDPDSMPLQEISYDEYLLRDVANSSQAPVGIYAVHPTTHSLWLSPPNAVYNMDVHYYRKPQILALDADVPIAPSEFHTLIVYQALADFSIFTGSSNLYSGYGTKATIMLGNLMRSQNPGKRVRTRGIV